MTDSARTGGVAAAEHSSDPRAQRSRALALRAARELLLEDGWSAVTYVAVSARSGVGRSTLYRHWPETSMLIRQVLAELFQAPRPVRTGELRGDLIAELGSMRYVLHDPGGERAVRVLVERATLDPGCAEILRACGRQGMDGLREVLETARAEGRLASSPGTETMVEWLIGPMVFRRLVSGERIPAAYVAELVDGFLATHGRDAGAA
ncbi:TetR/AcrR family transcriptional regulator [Streptomyces sp. WMMC897]|uniref:TetR/AcrR family transcriptional regulator n=1 Tax=Streptomyces sp. WMMC897 TaxID=3014782 RepID=UPI0022B6EA50|nr:TetR/AcrR family transcriptional regulator [Streptomyces sp. WMMC897]MCZ7414529.1 TetR/AcrR family transcriptional regulator [Streptomyces sp. WMMC897]